MALLRGGSTGRTEFGRGARGGLPAALHFERDCRQWVEQSTVKRRARGLLEMLGELWADWCATTRQQRESVQRRAR